MNAISYFDLFFSSVNSIYLLLYMLKKFRLVKLLELQRILTKLYNILKIIIVTNILTSNDTLVNEDLH
jgi:hypothetical protein